MEIRVYTTTVPICIPVIRYSGKREFSSTHPCNSTVSGVGRVLGSPTRPHTEGPTDSSSLPILLSIPPSRNPLPSPSSRRLKHSCLPHPLPHAVRLHAPTSPEMRPWMALVNGDHECQDLYRGRLKGNVPTITVFRYVSVRSFQPFKQVFSIICSSQMLL